MFLESVVEGDEPTMRRLLDFRRMVHARHPRTLASALHLAAIFEHAHILRALLDKDRTEIDSRDTVSGQTKKD